MPPPLLLTRSQTAKTQYSSSVRLSLILAVAPLAAASLFAQGTPLLPFTDFSGTWGELIHEDNYERSGGPPLGDYQGLPLNDAGRMKADSHDHSEWSLPEFQCRPHSAPYQWRALGSVRFWNEVDPVGRELRAIHVEYLRSLDRVIWMDGRPHPPAFAPHSWSGFSTGTWKGNTLVVTTTHIKGSYLRRNGAAFTDRAKMTEFIDRHGDILLVTTILDDPAWLEEPLVQTTNYRIESHTALSFYPCTVNEENISTAVPHFLPGETVQLKDAAGWIPAAATRGGAKLAYPDYRTQGANTQVPPHAAKATATAATNSPTALNLLPVQGNVYMLTGSGVNVAVSTGPDGSVVVDSGPASRAEDVRNRVLQLSLAVNASPKPNQCRGLACAGSAFRWTSPSLSAEIASPAAPKPVRYLINTSGDPDRVGGNDKLAELPPNSPIVQVTFSPLAVGATATIVAHENVLERMVAVTPKLPEASMPTETYHGAKYKISGFINGEGIEVRNIPAAHSDGDSLVYFRGSDVLVIGELMRADGYPVIDTAHGGSIDGLLDGLNQVLDIAIPEFRSQGGTLIIPGRGRLVDTGDLANYRNMAAIIRDRVKALKAKGQSLEQVLAARPSLDYDAWYGAGPYPDWTGRQFVEAVYKTVK
jgi:glyoxylase-like metal-dependent hydrolase (beta-lactamase superfamily II)